jgi:hypothetical protein
MTFTCTEPAAIRMTISHAVKCKNLLAYNPKIALDIQTGTIEVINAIQRR